MEDNNFIQPYGPFMEEWRPVKGCESHYDVSNYGRIKSLERVVPHSYVGYVTIKERILKLQLDSKGYRQVSIYTGLKSKKMLFIHQSVAESFLNHKTNGFKGLIVDHKNNIKTDNFHLNLQLVTARKNVSKDRTDGTSIYAGVCWKKGHKKWVSRIGIKGKFVHLGHFSDDYEAHLMYEKAVDNIHLYDGDNFKFRTALKNKLT